MAKQEEAFIDPRNNFEKIMDDFGYSRRYSDLFNEELFDWVKVCPYPNPNPDTIFGKFATRNNYFKSPKK